MIGRLWRRFKLERGRCANCGKPKPDDQRGGFWLCSQQCVDEYEQRAAW